MPNQMGHAGVDPGAIQLQGHWSMTTKYLRDRQEIPVHALKTIVADIKRRWRDQQANDGQEVSDGSDEESDLEEYKEKVGEEDGGFGGGDGQAGKLSIDTPEDPQVYCASMHAMEACSPAGVVIHIVAPGGERMRCNRLPLESCMILGGLGRT